MSSSTAKSERSRELLKLDALDENDLEVISTHLQDAVVRIGDMAYLPKQQHFALVLNRFDWEGAANSRRDGYRRRRAGLRFARVLSAQSLNLRHGHDDAVVELLAISFKPGDPPSGQIDLTFAGGGAIRLDVECIEARLSDLGGEWSTDNLPRHDLDDETGANGGGGSTAGSG